MVEPMEGRALTVRKYEDMRKADDPVAALPAFLNSVYDGAAAKAGCNKADHICALADRA
jgi:hypothetical protein